MTTLYTVQHVCVNVYDKLKCFDGKETKSILHTTYILYTANFILYIGTLYVSDVNQLGGQRVCPVELGFAQHE